MPSSGMFFALYIAIILIGAAIYIFSSIGGIQRLIDPIRKTYSGAYGPTARLMIFIFVPAVFGCTVFSWMKPIKITPDAMRIQHPTSNFPKKFETMKNPIANPTGPEIEEFIEQARNNNVRFLPQIHLEEGRPVNIEQIPKPSTQAFLKQVREGGYVDKVLAKKALLEKRLFEGMILYQINCRPCHGSEVAGAGPMAYGFKLRPIDFLKSETIETVTEGYIFWRVRNGGIGLPTESTPWDSAMPAWKNDLTEEEIWTIILAIYDMSGKAPLTPDKSK